MEVINQQPEAIAVFIARLFLGILFFIQGYDAIFKVKIINIIRTYSDSFAEKGIPRFITVSGAIFTSYVEFIGGFLLIIGLFKYWALYFLGIDLILASLAFGIVTPMWDMRHVFPRLLLLLFLLIVPYSWDIISLDNFLLSTNN